MLIEEEIRTDVESLKRIPFMQPGQELAHTAGEQVAICNGRQCRIAFPRGYDFNLVLGHLM